MGKEAEAQSLFMQYEESLRLAVKRADGVLDPDRPTDNAKAAIALQMIGFFLYCSKRDGGFNAIPKPFS